MISKIKKPVSILLSLIMVFSMFTIVPLTASAAAGDYVPESEYLTFTAEEAGSTVTLNVASGSNFQYDLNGAGLTGYTPGTPITLENVDDYVRFSGKDTTFSSSSSNHFSITGKVACSGNVMSLRLDDDGKVQGLTDYCFDSMFSGCTGLTSAPELPETELKNYCYRNMFYRCENLTKAPELPATNLANGCYSNMFNGCSKLTELPALPATTLATYCYHGMFYRCENLTKAPELPATNLADFCYYYMFYGCKSLTEAPALPATNLANSCYYSMFSGCTSLTKAPELPATNLEESCYNNMFYGCKSLTELPTLPATTLARTCYNYMFYGCSKICISDQAGTFGDITYSVEYRIPTTGEGTSAYNALSNMFKNTGGEFRGTPDINTTYYVPAPAPETFKVYVKKLTGGTYTIENLTGETTVAQLKEIIADQIDIPATAQRLIFSGKTLENDKQLSEYNIQNESTIHLVISTYTVTWLNYDNSELGTTTVQYGATPSYDGETPTKAEDADYTYTFYGWSDGTTTYGPTDTLPAVTGEVTYTAVFDATPNHVHNVVHVEEVPAGCTEPGRKAYYCCDDESCELYGRFFEDEELSVELTDLTIHALGHDYAAAVTEPSCTEGGFTTYTCSRCGDSYQDDFTEALGHDFGEWSVSEEPSCTEAGEEIAICARCGEIETRPVDALGHDYVPAVTEPSCTEGGFTTYTCSRCGDSYEADFTDPIGHDFGEWTVTTEPDCENGGEETRYCSRCDAFETRPVEALGHNYQIGEIIEPGCTEGGKTIYVCSRCGDSYEDDFTDPLGHDFGEWTVTTEPDCENDGEETRYCSRCDAFETRPVEALGHLPREAVQENYVAPTATTEGGYDTVVYCQRCNAELSREHTVLPATGPVEPIMLNSLRVFRNVSIGTDMLITFSILESNLTDYDSWYIQVTKDGLEGTETYRFGPEACSLANGTYAVDFTHISAKEMGVMYHAQVFAEKDGVAYCGPVLEGTMKQYLASTLTSTDRSVSATLKTLAADMLNYGAAAQVFLNYDTEHLVNVELSETELTALHNYETAGEASATKTNTNTVPTGEPRLLYTSVAMTNRVELGLFVSLNKLSGWQDAQSIEVQMKDHETQQVVTVLPTVLNANGVQMDASFPGIGAKNMRTEYDFVTLVDGVERGNIRTWSIEGYVNQLRNDNSSSDALKALANAVLIYGDSAQRYLDSQ